MEEEVNEEEIIQPEEVKEPEVKPATIGKKKVPEGVEIIIEGMDENDVTSLLNKWKDVSDVKRKLTDLDEMLRNKIKTFLKERNWERYMDEETKIGVSIDSQKRVTIDKEQLKTILTDQQMTQVTKTTTFEKMTIITPELRERLKSYVKPNKKISGISKDKTI